MRTFIENHVVGEEETAAKVGSGLLAVYATPQVVALMEHAACEVVKTLSGSPKGEGVEGEREKVKTLSDSPKGEGVEGESEKVKTLSDSPKGEEEEGAREKVKTLSDSPKGEGIEGERASGALEEGETTVGTRMAIDHVKACLVGETVTAKAELVSVEGRRYEFVIEVTNSKGEVLAKAEHTRFKVNAERFMGKLGTQI